MATTTKRQGLYEVSFPVPGSKVYEVEPGTHTLLSPGTPSQESCGKDQMDKM